MTMDTPYDIGFFEKLREGARRSARRIVPVVMEYVRPSSVIDVGCGTGTWLSVFREFGVEDISGVDGSHVDQSLIEIPERQFLARDLTQPLGLDRRFDLVVSLEVAEHLPESCAGAFVRSLAGLGPVVLFSAAIPHQGGTDHINEQWPPYWSARFEEHGFVAVDCLRRRFRGDEDVEWWYAQNAMFYVSQSELERHPRLAEERLSCPPAPLSLAPPKRFLEWVEWGMSRDRNP